MSSSSMKSMQTSQGLPRVTGKEPPLVEKPQNCCLGERGIGIAREGSPLSLDFSQSMSVCLKVKSKFPKDSPVRRFRNHPSPPPQSPL